MANLLIPVIAICNFQVTDAKILESIQESTPIPTTLVNKACIIGHALKILTVTTN